MIKSFACGTPGQCLNMFRDMQVGSWSVVLLSPDGQRIASGSNDNSAMGFSNGYLHGILEGHTRGVYSLHFLRMVLLFGVVARMRH